MTGKYHSVDLTIKIGDFIVNVVYVLICTRSSERQLHMYNASTLESVATASLDVSPAILVPHYDEDRSILFLSGRVGSHL